MSHHDVGPPGSSKKIWDPSLPAEPYRRRSAEPEIPIGDAFRAIFWGAVLLYVIDALLF